LRESSTDVLPRERVFSLVHRAFSEAVGEEVEARTREETARHGATTMWGKTRANWRVSLIMPPQSGSDGGRPRPRKPRVPIMMVTYPRRRQASTTRGAATLGRISMAMIQRAVSPRSWAAAT